MKITRDYPQCEFNSIESVVKDALTPSAYSYEGAIEALQSRIELQQEFIAKLTEVICLHVRISNSELEKLFGYKYNVED